MAEPPRKPRYDQSIADETARITKRLEEDQQAAQEACNKEVERQEASQQVQDQDEAYVPQETV